LELTINAKLFNYDDLVKTSAMFISVKCRTTSNAVEIAAKGVGKGKLGKLEYI
jgi:hypothetical protein